MVIAFLEVWQVLEIIEEQRGVQVFGKYSNWGMEEAIFKYLDGRFDDVVHAFFNKTRVYFNYTNIYDDLKAKYLEYDKLNKELGIRKGR